MKTLVKKALRALGYDLRRLGRHDTAVHQEADLARLKASYRDYKPLCLHLGCGPRVLKGWMNFDLQYQPFDPLRHGYSETYPPHLRGGPENFFSIDLTKVPLPLPDGCVDAVYHEDFIEHVSQRDQIVLLAELRRVLKPGGVHRISTPNLVASMRDHAHMDQGFRGVYVGEWDKWRHVSVLSPRMLEEMAALTGYSRVVFTEKNKSISNLMPPDFRPSEDRPSPDGNIFADLER